jgi:hypothetical protein
LLVIFDDHHPGTSMPSGGYPPHQLAELEEVMFSEDDLTHPEWEMSQRAQHWFTIGVVVVFAVVLLLDLVAGSP